MKTFVTGGTGYIGQALIARLLDEGHEVHALVRKPPQTPPFTDSRVKIFKGDLLDRDRIAEAITGCEQAFHIAAYARVWAKDPRAFFEINVQGTENILQASFDAGVKRVVFTSTGGTFGISNGSPVREDDIRMTDFFNEYESSKFMAEERVQHYARKGLEAMIVHPCRVYGPGLWTESNAVSNLIRAYVNGKWHVIPGDGESLSCFVYIDDVVDGHMLAMKNGRAGEKYILGGPNVTFNEFFSVIQEQSRKKYFLLKIPISVIMLFGWKEELMAKWFGKEPSATRKWIRKYRYGAAFSSQKAVEELGYKITPLEEGIARTLAWIQDDKQT